MDIMNSKVYAIFTVIINFLLLNLLWLLMCLPIVTIFPATAAMFGVVRQWILYKDSSVFSAFFRYFKENFKQSFLLGIIWLIVAFLFYADYRFVYGMGSIRNIMLPLLFLFSILFLFTTVFLFPIMVHYKVKWHILLKNSLFFSLIYFPATFLLVVIAAVTALLAMVFPITGFIIFSISAYGLFAVCNRTFQKMESAKGLQSAK